MKRIIDISDEYYKALTEIPNHQCTADMLIIKNSIPYETVTEFADRCKECGAKYGRLLKQYQKEIDHLHKYITKLETQIVEQGPICEEREKGECPYYAR